jgi:hypothetical protein
MEAAKAKADSYLARLEAAEVAQAKAARAESRGNVDVNIG